MKDEKVAELMQNPLVITIETFKQIQAEFCNPQPVLMGELCARFQRLRIVAELQTRLNLINETLKSFGEAPPIQELATVRAVIRAEHEAKKSLLEELIHLLEV